VDPSLEVRLEEKGETQRRNGERQTIARDALRASAANPHGDAEFAVKANYYLSLLPGF
jgi:hypothetical protein